MNKFGFPTGKLVRNGYYPAGEGEPERHMPGFALKHTGDLRPVFKGEWYLSGAIIEGYKAKANISMPHFIGTPVALIKKETWHEV